MSCQKVKTLSEEDQEPTREQFRKSFASAVKQQWVVAETTKRIKHRIAVWSAKGGVGKTTFAVNLAFALAERAKTGLLDADIDCPNIFEALGISEKHLASEGKILPIVRNNLQIVSMGGITTETILWRGPIVSQALAQFLSHVKWDVDALVADLSPGSSDVPITIAELLKPTGFIIVTTSDEMALLDAKKSIKFAQRLHFPIIGIVENMSGDIFGKGGGEQLAKEFNIEFLGSLPLDKKIREYMKSGKPLHKTEFKEVFENCLRKVLI